MAREYTAIARTYAAGTILFKERDAGDLMYVIRSGRVKIYRGSGDNELVLAFLESGDFLGEMALLEGLPRSASAMVVDDSVLIEVDAATFEGMIRRNIEIAVRIMRKLASRVRALDQHLEKMLVDSAQARALEVLRWLLPQGIIDGHWIRVRGLGSHFDIGAQAGIPPSQTRSVIEKLQRADCLQQDGEDLLIAEKQVLDAYGTYLGLKREYETLTEDDKVGEKLHHQPHTSLSHLMKALQIDHVEIEAQQRSLVDKYERYLELKTRFGELGDE